MAVIHSTIARVKPGRFEDMLSLSLETMKIHERLNVKTSRLMTGTVAGQSSGLCVYSTEHTSVETYAKYSDVAGADHELQLLFARVQGPDSPIVIEQQSLALEIPLGRKAKTKRGPVAEIHVSRLSPGNAKEAMANAKKACDFVESKGAVNARLFDLAYAGMGSGMVMNIWEYESMGAWAKVSAAWNTDAEGRSMAARRFDQDAPTLTFSGLYHEIRL